MAVKPYWWCPRCLAHHDLKPRRCVTCGHDLLRRGEARIASVESSVRDAADALLCASRAPPAVRESGPGIAALVLKAPPRQRPARHETKAWAPYDAWDALPDAEPGRYGWRS
jgi:hypothetical protein